MFEIIFYVFSFILAYLDFKKFIVPNNILLTLVVMLIIFGVFENRLNMNAFLIATALVLFFSSLIIVNKNMVLGGGDMKYMLVVAIFLEPFVFPFFLIITGVMQTIFLTFAQVVQKKQKAAMVPAMLISVILSNFLYSSSFFPFK